jgi:hypothetical protein
MKISSLMIGIVLCSMIVFGFTSYMASVYRIYSPDNYDSEYFQDMNRSFEQSYTLANQTRNDLQTLTSDTSILQKIDAFFSAGFSAFKMVFGSFNIFADLTTSTGRLFGVPDTLWFALVLIVMIAMFIGIFLSVIMKREL